MNELAPTALTVSEVGVARTPEKDHAKVTTSPEAILKKEVDACGGWVMDKRPAGADCGIEEVEGEDTLDPPLCKAPLLAEVVEDIIYDLLRRKRR